MNKMGTYALCAFTAAVVAAGCTNPDDGPDYTVTDNYAASVGSDLREANSRFAMKSFQEIIRTAPSDQNVFYSPLSVSIALGMLLNGAEGSTADSIRAVMELESAPRDAMNNHFHALTASLEGCDQSIRLNLANSVWTDAGFVVDTSFTRRLTTSFLAETFNLDLQAPATVTAINDWVASKTQGRIPRMYDQLPDDALFVLLNALYFKASWKYQFKSSSTRDYPFRREDGSTVTVKMMSGKAYMKFYSGQGWQAARLPYGRNVTAMYIFVPDGAGTVNGLINGLDPATWDDTLGTGSAEKIDISLPKFQMEYEVILNDVLDALGMGIAFSDFADLSGIAGRPGDLMVYEAKQKTFVLVNEEGTEAAASTGIHGGEVSAPPAFVVDRPFLFVIRDDRSGTTLFMGRMMLPSVQ